MAQTSPAMAMPRATSSMELGGTAAEATPLNPAEPVAHLTIYSSVMALGELSKDGSPVEVTPVPVEKRQFAVRPGQSTIGRADDCTIQLADMFGISSRHAVLEVADDGSTHFLMDNDSTNGTFINNHRLTPNRFYQVRHSDNVVFAATKAVYLMRRQGLDALEPPGEPSPDCVLDSGDARPDSALSLSSAAPGSVSLGALNSAAFASDIVDSGGFDVKVDSRVEPEAEPTVAPRAEPVSQPETIASDVEFVEAAEPDGPLEPLEPLEPLKAIEPAEPAIPAKTAEPSKPTKTAVAAQETAPRKDPQKTRAPAKRRAKAADSANDADPAPLEPQTVQPDDKPTGKPAKKPAAKPTGKPAGKPAEKQAETTKEPRRRAVGSRKASAAAQSLIADTLAHEQQLLAQNEPASTESTAETPAVRIMLSGAVAPKTVEFATAQLGAQVTDDWRTCTHLVTGRVRRTVKLMCAVAAGREVVSSDWLEACRRQHKLLPPADFRVEDAESATKYGFSWPELHQRLSERRAGGPGVFRDCRVFVAANVLPPPEETNEIVAAAGGEPLSELPTGRALSDVLIVATSSDADVLQACRAAQVPVYTGELVLAAVLQGHLSLSAHILASPGASTGKRRKRS